METTPIAPQGIVHQRSTPDGTTGPTEESEEAWGQTDPSRHTVGISLNQTEYTHEGRMMEPEQEPSTTGAHDTQRTDLTTTETVALVKLVNSTQNGMTYTSHTMSTGVGKADKPLTKRMD